MFKIKNLYRNSALLMVVASLLMVGCKSDDKKDEQQSQSTTDVRLQMNWTHEYSSVGLYAAEKKGHFKKEGLNVELIQGGFVNNQFVNPIDELLAGRADFVLSDAASILLARSQGKPVVAVMTVLQRSPAALISLKGENIARPQDLVGKTVSVSPDAQAIYRTLLASQSIDPSQVTLVDRTTFGIDPLLNGDVDAIGAWIINEGVMVTQAGQEANVILYSDYGINNYDFVITTTEQMIADRPELVQKFVRAIQQGLDDVLADPDKAVDLVLEYNSTLDKADQLEHLRAMVPLIRPPSTQTGAMQPEVWTFTHQVLVDQGILSTPIDVSAAYNTSFIDEIYGN
ncbi:MAG: ABC transporter substrate-binding protein [Chloroflexi bacterium]|nr:ABC transporter substrate-binding protein [Chloroflexota bacterium]